MLLLLNMLSQFQQGTKIIGFSLSCQKFGFRQALPRPVTGYTDRKIVQKL